MSTHYSPPSDMARMRQHFGVALDAVSYPSETWPCDQAPAILRDVGSGVDRQAFLGQFGLLPFWAKDPTLARRTFNARAKTAPERSSFKDAWHKGQRCIIPAEWVGEPSWETGKAVRWKISRQDGAPMGIAGLWSRWWALNGVEVMSFAMLTVDVGEHALMQRFQTPAGDKQMVAVLDEADYDRWLGCSPGEMMGMLKAYPAEQLVAEAAPMPPRPRA